VSKVTNNEKQELKDLLTKETGDITEGILVTFNRQNVADIFQAKIARVRELLEKI
jgi:hypothetical protein